MGMLAVYPDLKAEALTWLLVLIILKGRASKLYATSLGLTRFRKTLCNDILKNQVEFEPDLFLAHKIQIQFHR